MNPDTTSHIRKQIEELEDQRYRAMVASDLATLDRLFGEELVYIHSSAVADNKTQYLDSLRSGDIRYESFERSQIRIQIYGENTAAIFGRIQIKLEIHGQHKTLDNIFTNLWVRENGGPWRFVSWQSTPFPKPVV